MVDVDKPLFIFEKTNKIFSWWPTPAEGDKVISKLPTLFKNGDTLLHDGDLLILLAITAGSVAFFMIVFLFWKTVWRMSGS